MIKDKVSMLYLYGVRAGFSVVSGRNDLMGSIPMYSTEENFMEIKKGYNVVVESWENDWDACLRGLSFRIYKLL